MAVFASIAASLDGFIGRSTSAVDPAARQSESRRLAECRSFESGIVGLAYERAT